MLSVASIDYMCKIFIKIIYVCKALLYIVIFLNENKTDIQSTAETDLKLQQYILSS